MFMTLLKPCLEINYPSRSKEEKDILTFYNLSITESWGILLIYKQISENSFIEL